MNLLALAAVGQHNPVVAVARATNGRVVVQADPQGWSAALQSLSRAALPDRVERTQTAVRFVAERLANVPPVQLWDRTWLKNGATLVAQADDNAPLIAHWPAGSGNVMAVAFEPAAEDAAAFAQHIAAPPADPRYKISWSFGPQTHVQIDTQDNGKFLNGLAFTVEQGDDARPGTPIALEQIAPGRYAANLAAPPDPMIATLRLAGRVIQRRSIAGRYPAEFDAVGNDLPAMADLAQQSGGRVILPSDHAQIEFHHPRKPITLDGPLAAAGAAALAAGLVAWKRSNRRFRRSAA